MELEFEVYSEKKLEVIRNERRQLARTWRKESDSFKKILIQNRRKMLAEEFKQTTLNLGRSFN
jgi:16S rRNA A1518/A1519 N6-dimethyltransferase RsmA/KsgA/DIM1 with predicted DNA glycosylase/AP lyase activity